MEKWNFGFGKKCERFWRERNFTVWPEHNSKILLEKRDYAILVREYDFIVFSENTQLSGCNNKMHISGLTRKCDFTVLAENTIL